MLEESTNTANMASQPAPETQQVLDQNNDDYLLDFVDDGTADVIDTGEPGENLDQPELFTVIIKGKEKQVTREDLINHYQKVERAEEKFSEAAEIRRQSEEARQVAEQQRQQYLANQQQMEQAIQQVLFQATVFEPEEPDWQALLNEDPHEYLRQKEAHAKRGEVKRQLVATVQQMQRQREFELYQQQMVRLQGEKQKLLTEFFPQWEDPAVREKDENEYLAFLREKGYGEQEIQSLQFSQAKNIALVIDAMKYNKLLAKAKAAKKGQTTQTTEVQKIPTVNGNAAPISSTPSSQMTDKQFAEWRKKHSRR